MKILSKSAIIPVIIVSSLLFGYGIANAYHPENEKGSGAKKVEQRPVKKQEKLSAAVEKVQTKVDKAVQKLAEIEAMKETKQIAKEAKQAKKQAKAEVKADKGKGKQAKELKSDNRFKENKGRQNALQKLMDKINDSTRKMLHGLQNAIASITKWLGMDQAVESGQKYKQKLQEQK